MLLLAFMAGLMPDGILQVHAEVITSVTATISPDPISTCVLGNKIIYDDFIVTTTSGGSASVSESLDWEVNGGTSMDEEFTRGYWTLWAAVVIDGTADPEDSLSDSVKLTVNGREWDLYAMYPADSEDPDWIAWFVYPEVIDLSEGKLVLFRDPDMDIPETEVGVPITPFSVASLVKNALGSVTFSKESGPDWLSVSSDGTVSGTPDKVQVNDELIIKARDSSGAESTNYIFVDLTKNPGTSAIEHIEVASSPVEDFAQPGGTFKKVGVTEVGPEQVSVDPSSEQWVKYNKANGHWDAVPFGDKVTEGYYMYRFRVYADADKYVFVHTDCEDGNNLWHLIKTGTDSKGAYAEFSSDMLELPEIIDRVTVDCVVHPDIGGYANFDGAFLDRDDVVMFQAHWYAYDGTNMFPCDGQEFMPSLYTYYAEIHLRTADSSDNGTFFNDSVTVTIDGTDADIDHIDDCNIVATAKVDAVQKTDNKFIVIAGSLNVREQPSASAARIGGLHYGDHVMPIGKVGNWIKFSYDDKEAWVNRDYLALTHSFETAIYPVKYKITVGAVNVRQEPSTESPRIGGLSLDKEVLVTGIVKGEDGEDWLVLDYTGNGYHELGYVMKKYSYDTTAVSPDEDPIDKNGQSAKEDTDTEEVEVISWTYPTVTLVPLKAGVATGSLAELTEENFENKGDGYLLTTIYPDDAMNFRSLTADKIKLGGVFAEKDLEVADFKINEDGSITLKLGPKDPVTVHLWVRPDQKVDMVVPNGTRAKDLDEPEWEGHTFLRWCFDSLYYSKTDPDYVLVNDDELYAQWMVNMTGLDIHTYGTSQNSSNDQLLLTDLLEVHFAEGNPPFELYVSPLYKDQTLADPLKETPAKDTDYYFWVTVKDLTGKEGDPYIYFGDEIKDNINAGADDAELEFIKLTRSPGGSEASILFRYREIFVAYSFTKGKDAEWTRGSTGVLEYTVKRNISDGKTYSLFSKLEIDGTEVVPANYTASAGSLNASLKADLLNSLTVGTHTVRFVFEDGDAETTLTVKIPEDRENPKTGVDRTKLFAAGTIIILLIWTAFNFIMKKRSPRR